MAQYKKDKSVLIKNFLGNSYGVAVNFLLQILLVPLFIKYWGVDLYADWITITAFTTFFSMSDIGLNTVTMNAYSIAYHTGNYKKCDALVSNNAVLIISIFSIACVLILSLSSFISYSKLFNLTIITNSTATIILFCLVLKIGITMLAAVHGSIFRAKSKAYICFMAGNSVRLAEGIILIIGLICRIPIEIVILIYCIPSLLLLLFYNIYTKKFDFKIRFNAVDKNLFISLLIPSLSFMTFPLGYAILLQGFTLLVNAYFGAAGVVQYNTTRTLCNFIKVIPNSIKNSIWPEFTNVYAQKDISAMKRLYRITLLSSIGIVCFISIGIICFGDIIYEIWTDGVISFYLPLVIAFIVETVLNSTWEASTMTLMATNKHSLFGIVFLFLSAFNWLTVSFLLHIATLPIYGVVYFTVGMDCILVLISLKQSNKLFRSINTYG